MGVCYECVDCRCCYYCCLDYPYNLGALQNKHHYLYQLGHASVVAAVDTCDDLKGCRCRVLEFILVVKYGRLSQDFLRFLSIFLLVFLVCFVSGMIFALLLLLMMIWGLRKGIAIFYVAAGHKTVKVDDETLAYIYPINNVL